MALVTWLGQRRRSGRVPRAPDHGTGGPAPSVLELRVHGVNNTPPHALLDLPSGDVAQVAGDALGSFWRPTAEARERLTPQDRGYVPDGIEREAYSWGGLARTSPGGGTGLPAVVTGAIARIGWALLLPFGLVNVAFWSRRLEPGRGWTHGWQEGASAAALRVFALLLTLLLVGTAAVISLDLVAGQCFADGQRWCARLPAALDGMATLSDGRRLALGTLPPLATLALVAMLARVSRVRYEQLAAVPPDRTTAGPSTPALATPGFWANARLTGATGRLHVAGGLFFLVLTTAWHQVFATGEACTSPTQVLGSGSADCRAQLAALPASASPFVLGLVLAVLGLLATLAVLVSRAWGEVALPGNRPAAVGRWSVRLLVAGVVLLGTHLLVLSVVEHSTADVPLLGLVATPVLLATTLLAIAWSGRWWRRTTDGRFEAWGGRAPAVFLQLSLGVALTLSSVLVVAAGDWLNGGRPAGDLLRGGGIGMPGAVPAPPRDGCTVVCPVPDPALGIPSVYVWFGAATFLTLGVVLVLAAVAAVRTSSTLPAGGPVLRAVRRARRPGGTVEDLSTRPGAERLLRGARRSAAVAHRAEPVTRVLAEASAVCSAVAVLLTVAIAVRPDLGPPQLRRVAAEGLGAVYAGVVDTAAWGAGLVGLAVVGGMVGGAASGRTRPLGLAWDLICLLPRTGHPFGPPCYAERVVPELVRRCSEWVTPAGPAPAGAARRRVVVSAHSLGAVLTVASLVAARAEHGPGLTDRISLLTYGVQLRPYFGRMFPELFGPAVLGTAWGRGARLFTPDPWRDALAHDAARTPSDDPAGPEPTVVGILTGPDGAVRWVSLWRRTDYLGFPLDGYVGSRFDRVAEEIDTSGYLPQVATHGGYVRTGVYRDALADLRGP